MTSTRAIRATRQPFNKGYRTSQFRQLRCGHRFCRVAIEKSPVTVNMSHAWCNINGSPERLQSEKAIAAARIQLAPHFAKPYEDLGYLLVEQGRQKRLPHR